MTDADRISRETLLKRAAAAAGAVYAAPVLTSYAAAEITACSGQSCPPGKKGNKKCRKKGGSGCKCIDGRCQPDALCGHDSRCPRDISPCHWQLLVCNPEPFCVCAPRAPYDGETACVDWPSHFCTDYPTCSKYTGVGCPPGMCCLDANCCPEGICSTPCSVGSSPAAGSFGAAGLRSAEPHRGKRA